MSGRINFILTTLLVLCALLLVNAQYQARRLFIELERAQTALANNRKSMASLTGFEPVLPP